MARESRFFSVNSENSLNWRGEFRLVLLIGVATFLVFSPALGFAFVYDDAAQVVENIAIRSLHSIPQFFASHVWKEVYTHAPGNYYRPVFLAWLSLNYWLFGLKPMGWHLTSILLHALNSGLVYAVVRRLRGSPAAGLLAGLIFGIHPAHMETVAWVSGSTDSLFALFTLASFLMYLDWRDGGRAAWMAGSCAAYGLGLLAKETAIVLPVLIGIHAASEWHGRDPRAAQRDGGALWFAGGFLTLTAAYLAVRMLVLGSLRHNTANVGLATVLLSMPKVVCFYFRLLVWPFGLGEFYDLSYAQGLWSWAFFGPLLVLAALGALMVVTWRREQRRWNTLGLAWLVIPVLPVLDLRTFARYELAHDRYLYLSVLGFAVLLVSALAKLAGAAVGTFSRRAMWLFGGPVLAYFLVATVTQLGYWRNDLTLLTRARAIAPHNPTAANNLANIYLRQGNIEEAKQVYERVLAEWPDHWITAYNLGRLAYQEGRWEEAQRYFQLAVRLNPLESDSYAQLALVLYKMHHLDGATAAMGEAIRLAPEKRGYHLALGLMLKEMGDCTRAKAAFEEEARLNPGDRRSIEGARACGEGTSNGP